MAKKINAKDQTEELNRARLEFLKRNPEKLQKLVDLLQQNEKKRGEFLDCLSAISTMCDGENRDIWDFLLRETFFDKELKNKIKEIEIPPAVHSVWRWLDYNIETQYQRMANRENYNRGILVNLTNEEMKAKIIDMHCRDAREIFTELMNDRPAVHLLMGVDLSRSKGVILGEVEKLVTDYKTRLGIREAPEQRFKWLSIVDELLEIWDTWAGYGQRRCFSLIAKEKEIPESTVKARWRMAYYFIHGKNYSKEVAAISADELCARCKDQGKCYRTVKGVMDFYPCAAYLKLTGTSYTREKLLENFDAVADQYISENFED